MKQKTAETEGTSNSMLRYQLTQVCRERKSEIPYTKLLSILYNHPKVPADAGLQGAVRAAPAVVVEAVLVRRCIYIYIYIYICIHININIYIYIYIHIISGIMYHNSILAVVVELCGPAYSGSTRRRPGRRPTYVCIYIYIYIWLCWGGRMPL